LAGRTVPISETDFGPMSKLKKPIITDFESGLWTYKSSSREPGAFRAIEVAGLLKTHPEKPRINLYEWIDQQSWPDYAAISHVWQSSAAVKKIMEEMKQPLMVILEEGAVHEISWYGLVQAAQAAHHLECRYLWLDLLCIDQDAKRPEDKKEEKKEQIKQMGRIYEKAKAVLVMIGGVGAVQGIDEPSSWIDRAWTLQEASLCKDTYVVVDWQYAETFNIRPLFCDDDDDDADPDNEDNGEEPVQKNDDKLQVTFRRVQRNSGSDTASKVNGTTMSNAARVSVIPLRKLLEFDPTTVSEIKFEDGFRIKCFDSNPDAGLHPNATRLALLAVLEGCDTNAAMKYCGVWRSLMLRTSKKEKDMIFSIMHLLEYTVKDYNHEMKDLYEDVASMFAAKQLPVWLGVGGGSGDIIPRSGLVPTLPTWTEHQVRFYDLEPNISSSRAVSRSQPAPNKQRALVTDVISRSGDYIDEFDIRFLDSQIDFACCRMFKVEPRKVSVGRPLAVDGGTFETAFLSVGGCHGICIYKGNLRCDTHIIIVGKMGFMKSVPLPTEGPTHGNWYVNFVEYDGENGWWRVGAGMFAIDRGALPNARKHVRFGKTSSSEPPACDSSCGTACTTLYKTYTHPREFFTRGRRTRFLDSF
jgi:hypothetical protein